MKFAIYRDRLEVAAIFFSSLFFFLWGLRSQEIIGFESRFYLFALEMWRHGVSWFPTTYSRPYPDYPATSIWLIYLSARLLGGLNKLTAVLPSATAASLTVCVTYCLGRLHSRRFGLSAVLFLFLTVTFIKYARTISLDMYPTLITLSCFYLIYSADQRQQHKRLVWLYPLLWLGFLFRGPIGLVIPTGVVCFYYLLHRQWKRFWVTGVTALLLLIVSTALLLLLAHQVGGAVFMQDVLRMEVLGRIDNRYLPLYFYFTDSVSGYALSFPCAVLVVFGLVFAWLSRKPVPQSAGLKSLLVWVLVVMVGMSLPGDKKLRYILPMIPAVALLAASLVALPFSQPYFHFLRRGWLRLCLYLPAMLLLAVAAVFFYLKARSVTLAIQFSVLFVSLTLLQLVNGWLVYRAVLTQRVNEVAVMSVAALSLMLAYLMAAEPVALYVDRARHLVRAMETVRLEWGAQLVFYRLPPDGLPIKYLMNMPKEAPAFFIETPAALAAFSAPALFVTSGKAFAELPAPLVSHYRIMASDYMGHTRVVIFTTR
ncbi:MAG: hypothetical protein A3E85_01995 [Gammaproteobacteria bacterium RIFCSPHIGHO2_12_FULL_45_12]|nr:MAG: hypothetical protein A3E85_01995 [Gammaproteobacteria bacterium RIFCSPHIGHO2_12_FULL_45_12]